MAYFARSSYAALYLGPTSAAYGGWAGYLFPLGAAPPPDDDIDLEAAFATWSGSYLFSAVAPDLSSPEVAERFAASLQEWIAGRYGDARGLLWLVDPEAIARGAAPDRDNVRSLGFGPRLGEPTPVVLNALTAPVTPSLGFQITANCQLALAGGALTITASQGGKAAFTGTAAPIAAIDDVGDVPFEGAERGCIRYSMFLEQSSAAERLRWGFQTAAPSRDPAWVALSGFYPLVDPSEPSPTTMIGFRMTLDVTDVMNHTIARGDPGVTPRTAFAFTGKNQFSPTQTRLISRFRTAAGHIITLLPDAGSAPARLVFDQSPPWGPAGTEFLLAPSGTFTPVSGDDARGALLCGLGGTETVALALGADGARWRFHPYRAAFAASYPFPDASPVGPPPDRGPLLDETYTTSWTAIIDSAAPVLYSAQPDGAPLYGADALAPPSFAGMLGPVSAPLALPSSPELVVPMLPYAGVVGDAGPATYRRAEFTGIETLVVAPTRRRRITEAGAGPRAAAVGAALQATTPSGLVATVDGMVWTELALATSGAFELAFTQLRDPLRDAFQTNQLFLVVTDPAQLGAFRAGRPSGEPENAFYNTIAIEDWRFAANVGRGSVYGDYRNVLIFKFRTESLRALASNPRQWTQAEEFALPAGDLGDLTIVSQWLQRFLDDTLAHTDPIYDHIKALIVDPAWTGLLALNVDIESVPPQLTALLGGIDLARFRAHHVGVQLTPVRAADVQPSSDSALFGLVDYVDPGYDLAQPERTVLPDPSYVYDFRVLVLRALFASSAVQDFRSVAQLTLSRLFGDEVSGLGAPDNQATTLLLRGTYQRQGAATYYILDSEDDNSFYCNSAILHKVEITKAQLTTLDSGALVQARFSLWGFLDFHPIPELDAFSFGNETGEDRPRMGLSFANLGIDMTFAADAPAARAFAFDASQLAFDLAQSVPRARSLYPGFALQLAGIATGQRGSRPDDLGFLPIDTDAGFTGVTDEWYGLQCAINLGTPGDLAGKAGFDASLLLAWSPGLPNAPQLTRPALVAIKLPGTAGGAKLLGIEGVLKLSIGDLRLSYVVDQAAYLLRLSDIAVKFLGIAKLPPYGNTSFLVFGDPSKRAGAGNLGWYAVFNQDKPAGGNRV